MNIPIVSNFKAFSGTTEINDLPTSPSTIQYIGYKSIFVFILIIVAAAVYYYRDSIYTLYNSILAKLLLKLHINSLGQLVSTYIPTRGTPE